MHLAARASCIFLKKLHANACKLSKQRTEPLSMPARGSALALRLWVALADRNLFPTWCRTAADHPRQRPSSHAAPTRHKQAHTRTHLSAASPRSALPLPEGFRWKNVEKRDSACLKALDAPKTPAATMRREEGIAMVQPRRDAWEACTNKDRKQREEQAKEKGTKQKKREKEREEERDGGRTDSVRDSFACSSARSRRTRV
jgi:hypothetical protein